MRQIDLVESLRGRPGLRSVSQSSITRARRSDQGVSVEVAEALLRSLYPDDERSLDEMVRHYGSEVVRHPTVEPVIAEYVEEAAAASPRPPHVAVAATGGSPRHAAVCNRDFFVLGYRCGDGVPPMRAPSGSADDDLLPMLVAIAPSTCELALMSVPDVVRYNSSESQHSWFKLGLLLRELRTHLHTAGRQPPQAIRSANALDMLVGQSGFWPRLEDNVRSLVQSVRDGKDVNEVTNRIDMLKQTILDML